MSRSTTHRPWMVGFLVLVGALMGCAVVLPVRSLRLGRPPPPRPLRDWPAPQALFAAGAAAEAAALPVLSPAPRVIATTSEEPRMDHVAHAERGADCEDCHLADGGGGFQLPSYEGCLDCHEDMEEEWPAERRLSTVFYAPDGSPRWKRALEPHGTDVPFSHRPHEAAEIACTSCHGAMEGAVRRVTSFGMEECTVCHEQRQVALDCDACHREIAENVAPPSHVTTWTTRHGAIVLGGVATETQHRCDLCHRDPQFCASCHQEQAPPSHGPGWLQRHGPAFRQDLSGRQSGCAFCHADPAWCDACHRVQAPQDHACEWKERHGVAFRQAGCDAQQRCAVCHQDVCYCTDCHENERPPSHRHLWMERHGSLVRAGGPGAEADCAFCHTEPVFCERCHQDEPPRDHTTLFRTRTHGVLAAIDRDRCQTCHTTDFCVRCHEETEPRSHRGQWAYGRSFHCLQCHFPISSEPSCSVCHKGNPTHDTAPPQPPSHVPGVDCRICHTSVGGGGAPPLRHVDNGMNCEFCHQ